MDDKPALEYGAVPVAGAAVISATPTGVTVTVRPTSRRIVLALLKGVWTTVVIVAFVVWALREKGSAPWSLPGFGGSAAAVVFLFVVLGSTLLQLWPYFFPIVFEVTEEKLLIRWRALSEAREQRWDRASILSIEARRDRLASQVLKSWGLVLELKDLGRMRIYNGPRAETELIAATLRRAMGMGAAQQPAMSIPLPAGCRISREVYQRSVLIRVPPRLDRTMKTGLVGLFVVLGLVVHFLFLKYLEDDWARGQRFAAAAAVALLTLLALAIAWQLLGKARRRVTLVVNGAGVRVMETGVLSPMNVELKNESIRTIAVTHLSGTSKRSALRIEMAHGVPVDLCRGEREAHLGWLATVLMTGLNRQPQAEDASARQAGDVAKGGEIFSVEI